MISKIFITAKTFRESCIYVCQDLERAQVLDVEGVREHDLRIMADDFKLQQRWANQEKEKPVFHGVLSFPPGEDPGNDKLVEIARQYLKEIRVAPTQYVVVKHTDRAHLHLHILANRVSNTGKIVGEGLVVERGIKAARKLTQEFQLRQEVGKRLELTNLGALHEPDAKRYRLYQAIKEALPVCERLEDLEKKLLERGISTRYRTDRATGERQGISFRIENYCFKGSDVDRDYSLKGLEQRLVLQRTLVLKQEQALQQTMALRPEPEERKELKPELPAELKPEERQELRQELRLRQGPRLSL